jgi:hypothetical protein
MTVDQGLEVGGGGFEIGCGLGTAHGIFKIMGYVGDNLIYRSSFQCFVLMVFSRGIRTRICKVAD